MTKRRRMQARELRRAVITLRRELDELLSAGDELQQMFAQLDRKSVAIGASLAFLRNLQRAVRARRAGFALCACGHVRAVHMHAGVSGLGRCHAQGCRCLAYRLLDVVVDNG